MNMEGFFWVFEADFQTDAVKMSQSVQSAVNCASPVGIKEKEGDMFCKISTRYSRIFVILLVAEGTGNLYWLGIN